jgi:hypothetical protein
LSETIDKIHEELEHIKDTQQIVKSMLSLMQRLEQRINEQFDEIISLKLRVENEEMRNL